MPGIKAVAIGRALTSQPAVLAVHAALGPLMLVAGVSVLCYLANLLTVGGAKDPA